MTVADYAFYGFAIVLVTAGAAGHRRRATRCIRCCG